MIEHGIQLDHLREARIGFDEAIFAAGMTTSEQWFTLCRDAFDVLYKEGATSPKMMSVGMHMRIIGHPGRAAGLWRLLDRVEEIRPMRVVIAVAGMEGALPSVVGGLVERPVIAVPTSVGYGASFGGLAALLAMLNSCAAGVTVVNIDNGFGAGYAAARINLLQEIPSE